MLPTASASSTAVAPLIEPELALALALQAAPGTYALLVGSGLSSAAGIPTGWGIMLDLIRQLAPVGTPDTPESLEQWFRSVHHAVPNYSGLLQAIAPTPPERSVRLRAYFEPTQDERAEGLKVPTKAHHAIARLVALGYVRVIVTTNFDQLLETALRDAGVSPAVISSADGVTGAMPLQHERITVIKLHGDFMDMRLKNTAEELAQYDAPIEALLARVIDEYGLIICGWSATWDDALRAAILRAPNRRFTTFWAQHGTATPEAEALIAQRAAIVVPITGADRFFESVAERVVSLEDLRRPHPLTKAVAIASLKRYLPKPEDRIRMEDLIMTEVERVRDLARDVIPAGQPSVANLVTVVTRLGALSETLTSLAANGAHWWEPRHASLWARAIERVGSLTLPSGRPQYTWWADLLRYPAQLMMYAAGIVCSASRNDDALAAILLTPHFADTQGRQRPAASALNNSIYSDFEKQLPGRERQFMPWCEHLFEVLEPVVAPFLSNPSTYKTAFERFELITALSAVHGLGHEDARYASFPVGRAWYMRHNVYPRSESQVDRLGEEIRASGAAWPLLRHGLFGGSVDRLNAMYAELDTQTQRRLT